MKTEEEIVRKFKILDAEWNKGDEAMGVILSGDAYRDHVLSFLSALGWVLGYDPTNQGYTKEGHHENQIRSS